MARPGALSSAVTALGLHRERDITYSSTTLTLPSSAVSELARCLYVAASYADEQLTTFIMRPAALRRPHCTCRILLNLSDSDLISAGDAFSDGIAWLDAQGWNQSYEAYPATHIHAWMVMM